MCLITFSWNPKSSTPLRLSANRDEFHHRPTAPAQYWPEQPHIFAGKDLQAGGTWLGVNQQGGFAALTNYREIQHADDQAISYRSRGELVEGFLNAQCDPIAYLEQVALNKKEYQGFNLLVGNAQQMAYYSNRSEQPPLLLLAGVYGLSNALLCQHATLNQERSLNQPWPKVTKAMQDMYVLQQSENDEELQQHLLSLLSSTKQANNALLPNTGVPSEWEQLLSSQFIINPAYGTRCSTALTLNNTGKFRLTELSFDKNGAMGNTITAMS
jgi:uncharacterized protein with NRDE domain